MNSVDKTTTLNPNPSPGTKSELISRRAEVFRSKLIHEFHLLETVGEEGSFDTSTLPYLFTRDIIEETRCQKTMLAEPSSLIQFQVYSNKVCEKSFSIRMAKMFTLRQLLFYLEQHFRPMVASITSPIFWSLCRVAYGPGSVSQNILSFEAKILNTSAICRVEYCD